MSEREQHIMQFMQSPSERSNAISGFGKVAQDLSLVRVDVNTVGGILADLHQDAEVLQQRIVQLQTEALRGEVVLLSGSETREVLQATNLQEQEGKITPEVARLIRIQTTEQRMRTIFAHLRRAEDSMKVDRKREIICGSATIVSVVGGFIITFATGSPWFMLGGTVGMLIGTIATLTFSGEFNNHINTRENLCKELDEQQRRWAKFSQALRPGLPNPNRDPWNNIPPSFLIS